MRTMETDVVVIGGGSTGAGVVRDVAMRGFRAILLDRADMAQGTSGRYHGLLHSGGRYIASDPESATECAEENAIVSRINADAVERTGGLFVTTSADDEEYADLFLERARAAHVPAEEISPAEALRREPRLDPHLKRAFAVEDGTVDGWRMTWGAARSAIAYGAEILTYTRATGIQRSEDRIEAVFARDERTGEDIRIDCSFVLNCGGPWAGQIAALADCHGVEVVPGAGIMIAMNHRLSQTVINRCIWPADGDILVPVHPVCIIGTTDLKAEDPDKLPILADQVQQMLDAGEALIPGFRQSRALHAWAGARPLIKDSRVSESDTRHMARGMHVVDHLNRDGVDGILTIAGGKLTTYRLMASLTSCVSRWARTVPAAQLKKLFPRQKESRTTTSATASTKLNTTESRLPAKRLSVSVSLSPVRCSNAPWTRSPGGSLTTCVVRFAWEWDPAKVASARSAVRELRMSAAILMLLARTNCFVCS